VEIQDCRVAPDAPLAGSSSTHRFAFGGLALKLQHGLGLGSWGLGFRFLGFRVLGFWDLGF